MKELIELTFEDVSKDNLALFINDLVVSSSVVSGFVIQGIEDLPSNLVTTEMLIATFNRLMNGTVLISIGKVYNDNLNVARLDLQVLKSNDIYDLNVLCERETLFNTTSVEQLQRWSGGVAKKIKAKTYFCGLEPAIDAETRFFTENVRGPIW